MPVGGGEVKKDNRFGIHFLIGARLSKQMVGWECSITAEAGLVTGLMTLVAEA